MSYGCRCCLHFRSSRSCSGAHKALPCWNNRSISSGSLICCIYIPWPRPAWNSSPRVEPPTASSLAPRWRNSGIHTPCCRRAGWRSTRSRVWGTSISCNCISISCGCPGVWAEGSGSRRRGCPWACPGSGCSWSAGWSWAGPVQSCIPTTSRTTAKTCSPSSRLRSWLPLPRLRCWSRTWSSWSLKEVITPSLAFTNIYCYQPRNITPLHSPSTSSPSYSSDSLRHWFSKEYNSFLKCFFLNGNGVKLRIILSFNGQQPCQPLEGQRLEPAARRFLKRTSNPKKRNHWLYVTQIRFCRYCSTIQYSQTSSKIQSKSTQTQSQGRNNIPPAIVIGIDA